MLYSITYQQSATHVPELRLMTVVTSIEVHRLHRSTNEDTSQQLPVGLMAARDVGLVCCGCSQPIIPV